MPEPVDGEGNVKLDGLKINADILKQIQDQGKYEALMQHLSASITSFVDETEIIETEIIASQLGGMSLGPRLDAAAAEDDDEEPDGDEDEDDDAKEAVKFIFDFVPFERGPAPPTPPPFPPQYRNTAEEN